MKRKSLYATVTALLLLMMALPAMAQSYQFRNIHMSLELADSYIILTPDNLEMHEDWVRTTGRTRDEIIDDWNAAGVLLTAKTPSGDVEITLTASKDEDSEQYFDLDQQTDKARAAWRNRMSNGEDIIAAGYKIQTCEWKKLKEAGRFLYMKYKQTNEEGEWRGLKRCAIRNGYLITIDYRITGRAVKNPDTKAFDDIMKTVAFTEILEKPAAAAMKATITSVPPLESSTGVYAINGTCDPGMKILCVVMKMSSSKHQVFEGISDKNGKFSVEVKLPEEGIWLTTLSVENGDTTIQEEVFNTTTYQKSLLSVNFDQEIPAEVTGTDVLVVSGTTIGGVTIQCILDDAFDKQVTTSGTGRFSFKLPVSQEKEYDLTIVFSKKHYNTRRYTYHFTRVVTEADLYAQAKENAIKPAYATLTEKLKGYTGRVMRYTLYPMETRQDEDGSWSVKMAMGKSSRGYRDFVVVKAADEPALEEGKAIIMVGQCVGSIPWEEEGLLKEYPGFSLIFWE